MDCGDGILYHLSVPPMISSKRHSVSCSKASMSALISSSVRKGLEFQGQTTKFLHLGDCFLCAECMSRVARIVAPGFAHHVTQRGNRRADVFETADDYEAYLRFLKQYADKRGLSVWAYCLMRNHVPSRRGSASRGFVGLGVA